MHTLFNVVLAVQVLSAVVIVVLVLLQHGKGADMGAAFGAGSSGSLFGATGASNFLSKSTGLAAVIFFSSTLALAFFTNKPNVENGVMGNLPVKAAPASTPTPAATPATPATSVASSVPASPASQSGQSGQVNQIPR